MAELTVGSLFSGIGGLDLGLERAGMKVIWQSEIDPYACRVLAKHWPEVTNHGDIKRIDWGNVIRPDVICGGYPCQPFSNAGRRKGEDDPRHLWPWVREAISRLRPRYAVLENVRGHLSLGGLSVIGDLTAIGYDAEWRVISAASVGANHRRDRVVIVAYPNDSRGGTSELDSDRDRSAQKQRGNDQPQHRSSGRGAYVANDDSERNGFEWSSETSRQKNNGGVYNRAGQTGYVGWQWWETEPNVGRVADGIPARVDRLRGLGNAVVPQVAEVIGRMVVAHAQECP